MKVRSGVGPQHVVVFAGGAQSIDHLRNDRGLPRVRASVDRDVEVRRVRRVVELVIQEPRPSRQCAHLRGGQAEIVAIDARVQPAQRFESFFRDMQRLIHEGKIKHLPPKEPRSAIYAAMLFGNYADEIRTTKPPNGVFQALALVGKVLRFKV